jgi:outer membrane protein OmpA-like peptidoglycan-associated protein
MSQRTVGLGRFVAVVLPLAVVAGCASSDQQRAVRTQMERAQAAYQQAQGDPSVQTYAQLWLVDAQKALQAAEQAKNLDEKLHLGYLAERKAQLAAVTGATGKIEQTLQLLGKETAEMLLKKRERELTAARATGTATATDSRSLESEKVRIAAEARVREAEEQARAAEQARRREVEAEAKARAAEQAKGAELAKELASLRAQQTDRGLVLTIGDVLFDAGKATVGPGAQRSIDKLAEFLKTYPKRNVLIEGHSDSFGNEDFNLKLSQQRADAVRDLLVARGIASQRIRTKGYGAKFPLVDNDTPVGRQQNRRVEVLVLTEGSAAAEAPQR